MSIHEDSNENEFNSHDKYNRENESGNQFNNDAMHNNSSSNNSPSIRTT